MHFLLIGILLGLGAAVPIGPVNLEMIRRNLRYGTAYGIMLGVGACTADVTYLILLCVGALALLQYPQILNGIGFTGSLILLWFGIGAFRANVTEANKSTPSKPSLIRYALEGYAITLLNPFTILFWASISSQISLAALSSHYAIFFAGIGVVIGTMGWMISLNTLLHFTRHKLTHRTIKLLNHAGGVILIGFAVTGIIRAVINF